MTASLRFLVVVSLLALTGAVAHAQVVVKGNVYGGCELGKVKINSSVTNSGNSTVTINGGTMEGSVYGGGMGDIDAEEIEAGLVEGNTEVNMSDGTVKRSIYGGGMMGSVGKFTDFKPVTYPSLTVNVPTECQDGTGEAKVVVSGGSVGDKGSYMPVDDHNPEDDDKGWVFCGSQGKADSITYPKVIAMGVVGHTNLEIKDNALITASAYGGCENGLVLYDTYVKVSGGQIGTGYKGKDSNGVPQYDGVYEDAKWMAAINAVHDENITAINAAAANFHECHAWPYGDGNGNGPFNVYDIFYGQTYNEVPYQPANTALTGSDGHSFFGNVFGGGSGYYPIRPGVWRYTAGQVNGNATIDIVGGHILTTVYGGNECTDVKGKVTINMSGGTVGVPRDSASIAKHPVTCSMFGGGMGDPRVWANTWTNVNETEVNITGGTVFGSVFGGGEEGHVLSDVTVSISENANAGSGNVPYTIVGTLGYSSYEGNVFGAGRGFSGEALTAGTIGGNSNIAISSGKVLGSVYGGGRNASVGTQFTDPLATGYGQFNEDGGGKTYGHVVINISGGTIGNNHEHPADRHTEGGNVYGGSMGHIKKLDNTTYNPLWPRMARVKSTHVNVTGGTIKSIVYGGAEYGSVRDSAVVVINDANGTIYKVFGGGYGTFDITSHQNDSSNVAAAKLAGRVQGNTLVKILNGTIQTSVYGGGEFASVGMVKNNTLLYGNTNVVVKGGIIGNADMYHDYNPDDPNTQSDHMGHVFGGGQGIENDPTEARKLYCNVNNTRVDISGGRIYGSIFGGGADSHVLGNDSVFIHSTDTIGTRGLTSWDGDVFGGGKGYGRTVEGKYTVYKTMGRVGGNTYINIDTCRIMGSVFGGGRLGLTGVDADGVASFLDGQVYDSTSHGLATIVVTGKTSGSGNSITYSTNIGTSNAEALLSSDESVGDIFGSGKGDCDYFDDIWAGRTANTSVTITGSPRIYGGVFGGGEQSGVGYYNTILNGVDGGKFYEKTGAIAVTVGRKNQNDNPVIGTVDEFTISAEHSKWTLYDTINDVVTLLHTCTGNVFGGSQGDVKTNKSNWVTMARARTTYVNVHGGTIMSCVHGGAEHGTVLEDTHVNVTGGTIGAERTSLIVNTITSGGTYHFGSVFGGGYGSKELKPHTNDSSMIAVDLAGRTYGNTYVNVSGGHVYDNIYGGGHLASVGRAQKVYTNEVLTSLVARPGSGHCKVQVSGTAYVGPLDSNGMHGYVFGGSKGVGDDPLGEFNPYCNVNSTEVIASLDYSDDNNNTNDGIIAASLYGGSPDGHVLDSTYVELNSGIIGTYSAGSISAWGGNIFGGGRNYYQKNYAAGRVMGNTHVVMNGGTVLASVFGGGRMGSVGVDMNGQTMLDGNTHGNTLIEIKGGTIGCREIMPTFTQRTIGDVYGGGKGTMEGLRTTGHPVAGTMLISMVKNTRIRISEKTTSIPTIIYGTVFGGGEVANVGKYAWTEDPNTHAISNIQLASDGKTEITVSGGRIGADLMKMRPDIADGPGNYDLKYNDDVGHVYGGGEGRSINPNDNTLSPAVDTEGNRLVDMMATVGSTDVTISGGWVKGSVYGGAAMGHVRGDTKVTIGGGQIGAGYYPAVNTTPAKDSLYAPEKFFNPVTYFSNHPAYTDIAIGDTLKECVSWDFDPATNRFFDPVELKANPSNNYANSKPTNGHSWFGNVYGGGSGYYPYIRKKILNPSADSAVWNPEAGKVYGNSRIEISGGHILSNVYGGGEIGDMGTRTTSGGYAPNKGKAVVKMSGGTVGVPRKNAQMARMPFSSNIFGAGRGDSRSSFNALCNVVVDSVIISDDAIVYGCVFGGAEVGHVIDSTNVWVKKDGAAAKTPVIGTTGISGYDGHVFGGGWGNRNIVAANSNWSAGRVGGNAHVKMTNGAVLGNLYGGGFVARVGVGEDGNYASFITNQVYDSEHHGLAKVDISGGYVGNDANGGRLLLMSDEMAGNVFGGGRGDPTEHIEDDFGRVANSVANVSGSPTIYGNVFGGGQMANSGHWNNLIIWYTTGTSETHANIKDSPSIGTALEFDYENYLSKTGTNAPKYTEFDIIKGMKMITHTRTGNVYGSGMGDVRLKTSGTWVGHPEGFEQGHCGTAYVNISGTPTIMSSVFGGADQGVVWGNTEVTINGGTIGTQNITYDSLKYVGDHWEFDNNDRKYSHGNVYGGSYGMDAYKHVDIHAIPTQYFDRVVDSINRLTGCVYGNTEVNISGSTIIRGNVFGGGDMANVGTKPGYSNLHASNGICHVNVSGGEIGPLDGTGLNAYVFGGGNGFAVDSSQLRKAFANVDSTFVSVSGGRIHGSIFGGGNDSHTLGSTKVTVSTGADIGTDGLSTWDGNIFGGGRNFVNSNHSNGRVEGNIDIEMTGGTIQGSIFGGGRLALSGVNENGEFPTTSWDVTKHGNVTINVRGGSIGNTNGYDLLTGSDESVGDIFGSGKGDTKNYMDIVAGRVTNSTINISGNTHIYGAVFGGGEMASLGWWTNDGFISGTGAANITIDGNPTIGTELELNYGSLTPSEWTIYDSITHELIHTCTGNVFGGCQGDIDFEDWSTSPNHWYEMGRSDTAVITINGGTIMGKVMGGPEQGTMDRGAHVTVNGGTIGSNIGTVANPKYFGGVYGAGYGSDSKKDNLIPIDTNGPTADKIAGRMKGNVQVDMLGGTVRGNVFGGASFAYVGDGTHTNKGKIQLNIGNQDQIDANDITQGTTILGEVYAANDHSGTPYGSVRMDVYHTKHTTDPDNRYPINTPLNPTPEWLAEQPNGREHFALQAVYGGSNKAPYTPLTGGESTVCIHECRENTIYDVYGGSNAADIGPSTTGADVNTNLEIWGGRMHRVFGGGNGEHTPANIYGTANTTIFGGLIDDLFGGSNTNGFIEVTNLSINETAGCPLLVDTTYGGSNEAPVIGEIVTTVACGEGVYGTFYGGTSMAPIYGNVTTNIKGGTFDYVFAGSQGRADDPATTTIDESYSANIMKYPLLADVLADSTAHAQNPNTHPLTYPDAVRVFMRAHPELGGTGGTVTLNLFGGTINKAAFGGSDVNGKIDSLVLVNVIDVVEPCGLSLDTLYGSGRQTSYKPDLVGGKKIVSPIVNVIHGTVKGDVFGGAKGDTATVISNPVVRIGYDSSMDGVIAKLKAQGHLKPSFNPADPDHDTLKALVKGDVFGGGNNGQIAGSTTVTVYKHNTVIDGNVFGGGLGDDKLAHLDYGLVQGSDTVRILAGWVKNSVYGGGALGSVNGNTHVELTGGTIGVMTLTGHNTQLDIDTYSLEGGKVYGGGRGAHPTANHDNYKDYAKVKGNTYVHVSDTAKIREGVYGGGALASVGGGTVNTGLAKVIVSGGEVGPLSGTVENANVYGGGRGDIDAAYKNFANVDTTSVIISDSARICGSVYGGSAEGHVLAGTCVEVKKGTNHKDKTPYIGTIGVSGYDGHVFGGGKGGGEVTLIDAGDPDDPDDDVNEFRINLTCGRVGGNTKVEISDGTALGCVYGGGQLALVGVDANGSVDSYVNSTTHVYDSIHHGLAVVEVKGGTIGTNAGTTTHPLPNWAGYALLESDYSVGDIFGGGSGDVENYEDILAGRVANAKVTVKGTSTKIYSSIFGGGEIAGVGYWHNVNGKQVFYGKTGSTQVNITESPTIGTELEFSHDYAQASTEWTVYDTINNVRALAHTCTGNVFGASQGDVSTDSPHWVSMGRSRMAYVNISGTPTIMASVFGGAEQGTVAEDTHVHISGGTIGQKNLPSDSVYWDDSSNEWVLYESTEHPFNGTYSFGSVYGGGYGVDSLKVHWNDSCTGTPSSITKAMIANYLAGRVYGNTCVTISGGIIRENVFGGGNMASVGWVKNDGTLVKGKCTVNLSGKSIVGELDMTGLNGYVYGGGKGIGKDPNNLRKAYCNVNETDVTVNLIFANAFDDDHISRPNRWSSTTDGRIYGSIFGGGADGHTLGDAWVKLQSGLIGTEGTTSWDGNIFGGGRNFLLKNYTAGRVGGNVTVEMTGGHLLGSLYGGGRNALTGLGEDVIANTSTGAVQTLQDDTDPTHPEHGKITVMVKGGVVGNNTVIDNDTKECFVERFSTYSMGSVYGGGKGTNEGISGHKPESALLISMVKETDVQISQDDDVPTRIYGIVFGGGEMASVGNCTWIQDSEGNISNIDMKTGTGKAKVTISDGIIGADRAKMRYDEDPAYPQYPLYNDDLGYVYGGGEGYSDDPWKEEGGVRVYPDVSTAHFGVLPILDIMASVNNTEVNISGGWVKASVFGGAEAGHVLQNTKVNISGGQIGAGDNGTMDLLYTDGTNNTTNQFINPIVTEVTTSNSLYGTTHWRYASPYNPYDPAEIANDPDHYEPTDGKSWFGNVFGGGSGWFPYIKNLGDDEHPNYKSYWNANSGKVWGDAEVNITGGHILNNVYGANETTDVGGKATVKMSGGTVGVPRTKEQVAQQPVTCYVFGGGGGEGRSDFDGITNCASTDVQISGGIIYGSVFGGAEDGHVLGNVEMTVSPGASFTVGEEPNEITYHYPVIGSTGKSGADGNIFCGGRNFFGDNQKAGRVEGNITLNMSGGALLGSVFGGGRYALTGIKADGTMKPDIDPTDPTKRFGYTDITISGGVVGNRRDILDWLATTPHTSMGDVFASGKGDAKNPELGKVKNSSVTITGTAEVLGSVYGGGEMANVGWYTTSGANFSCDEGTGDARVTISGNAQVGIEQYETAQVNIVGGGVYGGGKGVPGKLDVISPGHYAVAYGNVGNTLVTINGGYITNSVFGGGDNGHVITNTVINMSNGTVGQRNTVDELEVDEDEQFVNGYIYTGSVLGGGRGTTPLANGTFSDMSGRVFGNATVTISGGTVRRAVYGGGGLATVGTTANSNDEDGLPVFESGGTCTVTITGGHIGPTKADMAGYSAADSTKFFKNLGGNAGLVFGAGCGLAGHSDLTFNNQSIVSISGNNTQIVGAVYGGGETAHVKGNTNVTISGGTIGGIPLHGSGWVSGTGAFAGVNFSSDVDELAEDDYGAGSRVFHGNVYGGGKGTDFLDKTTKTYSRTAGRVYGNTNVTIEGGTIYNRVFGGGSLASVGIYNTTTVGAPDHAVDSITSLKSGGTATVLVKGGTIGTDGNNNGDVFGGGLGLVGRHWDQWHQYNDQVVYMAYVGKTDVTIQDDADIRSNVYGGSANGHVQGDAYVTVTGGTIGIEGHGGWHSNVYGGGGGYHQYQKGSSTHFSITSGRVFGNTHVNISGGNIKHNVYGGGAIASVGTYNIYDPTNYIATGTGDTHVTITGGTIGYDGNENGMVFGSGRGHIDAIDAFMDSLSYVVNSTVTIGTLNASTGPMVHGSVYGSGENGHTFGNAQVNVHSGTIGCESYNHDHASFFANHGNVYGAGCGTDTYIEGGEAKYNPRSGMVNGNTEVNITGGLISHNVYGGGAMALVGSYTTANPHWQGGINAHLSGGKTIVNISGGTIGTSDAPTGVNHGDVYAASRGPNSGNGFTDKALVDQAFVNISGTADVLGSVYGGGQKSLVRTSRVVNINGGTVEQDVYGGSKDSLMANYDFTSPKTVNMRGGLVMGDVFGGSHNANEGNNPNTWTSFVNISGGTVNGRVFAAGNGGHVNGSVCANIGTTAITSSGGLTENANTYYNKTGYNTTIDPSVAKLLIKGGVYGGSHHFKTTLDPAWNKYDIEGSSAVFVDGTGYDMAADTAGQKYMYLADGIYGSGALCESGKLDRRVYIRNYGERTNNEDGSLKSVTRPLTTIQRGGTVLLDKSNIKFTGAHDITPYYDTERNFAILQVDKGLYVTNGSGLILGDAGAPVYMDSIYEVKSLYLKDGVANSYLGTHNGDWEMIGINGDSGNKLGRIQGGSISSLDRPKENVIIFNDKSQLYVRYHDKSIDGTKYGELYGFFRMLAPNYSTEGTESFAYARPKLTKNVNPIVGYDTSGGNTWNEGDGGFLSYETDKNFFTKKELVVLGYEYQVDGDDGGSEFTNTKQYPYYNELMAKKGNMQHRREWVLPVMEGKPWYVDGRGIGHDGWGKDETHQHGWGHFPDKPKRTISGTYDVTDPEHPQFGGICNDISPTPSDFMPYDKIKDVIFVVGPVEAVLENDNLNNWPDYTLRLYRYPGGHKMSNDSIDITTSFGPSPNPNVPTDPDVYDGLATGIKEGPGPNLGMMIHANKTDAPLVMNNVLVDGLYEYTTVEAKELMIPESFATDKAKVHEPLVVNEGGAKLTLKGGTSLARGYNSTNASGTISGQKNYYLNPDFDVTDCHNGGALFMHSTSTVNVEGLVTIMGNKQRNVSGVITSNVYMPTFDQSLTITAHLEKDTKIGVTSPIRKREDSYEFNTLSPVAVVPESYSVDSVYIAAEAWSYENFHDDQDWFFGSGSLSTYYDPLDYGGAQCRTLYFGWTWANVVRTMPTGFNTNNINSAEDLAWLISKSVGMNGETATNFSGTTILQTADLDMKQYVWVPIGDTIPNHSDHKTFSGHYDGQGHLIKNLSIAYIGKGDGKGGTRRYERQNYGLFGYVKNGTVDRTFVVSGTVSPKISVDITNADIFNIGGLVGCIENSTVSNSEAALNITCPNKAGTGIVAGGLVAKMVSGEVHSSMAMPWISSADNTTGPVGGLVGSAIAGRINNSFVNARFSLNAGHKSGGLLGSNTGATMLNCYVNWYSSSFVGIDFKGIVNENEGSVDYCYAKTESGVTLGNSDDNGAGDHSKNFTATDSADKYGYMYKDNTVPKQTGTETVDTAMFRMLNIWVDRTNTTNGNHKYARWARPGLSEINGDYPVLLLNDMDGTYAHQGDFGSLATVPDIPNVLQYGGTVRDGNELDGALHRLSANNALFIYGDILSAPSESLPANAKTKISIYEDVSILNPGTLSAYDSTYVGITFDNSFGKATATSGMNSGLYGSDELDLPRDWHMFSTPLSDAPLGFNYNIGSGDDVINTNVTGYPNGGTNAGNYYNNPWEDEDTDFSWLQSGGSDNIRYWMYGWENSQSQNPTNAKALDASAWKDGYFPSQTTSFGADLMQGTDEWPSNSTARYPYGMDFYTWNEPEHHWINFKRNGPNHWHSDLPHVHLNYTPAEVQPGQTAYTVNQNENDLIVGRGYMAAIASETFMQSHGTLTTIDTSIMLTNNSWRLQGWNLVGNPFHGYLDFDEFGKADGPNNGVLGQYEGKAFYVVYDADKYSNHDASTAYRYYPVGCSYGGEYADQYLHPHQGFYVRTDTGGKLTFKKNMLVPRATVAASDWDGHFRNQRPAYPLVNLFLSSDQGCADVTVIEFERPEWGGALKQRDLRIGDGQFYAHHDEGYYAALFAKAGIDRVPLWFEAKEDDIFTMKWNTANGEFQSMYLIDNLVGVQYDMLRNDTYTFEGHKEDYPSRFLIVFNVTGVEEFEDDGNHPFAFFDGGQWLVTGDGVLQFIDVHGRILAESRVSGQSRITLPKVADGPYMFRLTNSQETKVQKVIVRN